VGWHNFKISQEFNFADEGDLDFPRELILADLSKKNTKSAKFNSLKLFRLSQSPGIVEVNLEFTQTFLKGP